MYVYVWIMSKLIHMVVACGVAVYVNCRRGEAN